MQILNKYTSGFSLIELLVTIVIVASVAAVGSNSLFTLLRGATKTETLKEVKQNGDYALSVLELKIRNARTIISACPVSTPLTSSTLTIENPDTTVSTFSCVSNSGVRRIQENITPPNQNKFLTSNQVTTSADCSTTNFAFSCVTSQIDGKSKTVTISFSLSQAIANPTGAESTMQRFSTQVSIRNK